MRYAVHRRFGLCKVVGAETVSVANADVHVWRLRTRGKVAGDILVPCGRRDDIRPLMHRAEARAFVAYVRHPRASGRIPYLRRGADVDSWLRVLAKGLWRGGPADKARVLHAIFPEYRRRGFAIHFTPSRAFQRIVEHLAAEIAHLRGKRCSAQEVEAELMHALTEGRSRLEREEGRARARVEARTKIKAAWMEPVAKKGGKKRRRAYSP